MTAGRAPAGADAAPAAAPATPAASDPVPAGRPSTAWIGAAVTVAGLVALAVAFRGALADAAGIAAGARAGWLVAAVALLAAGRVALPAWSWGLAASAVAGVPPRDAAVTWLRATVTKYLPGGVWQPVSVTDRLRRLGAPLDAAAAVTATEVAASAVGGALVGAAALPALAADRGAATWSLVAVLPMAALLHPRVLAAASAVAARVTGRPATAVAPSWRLLAGLAGLQAAGWVAAGLATAAALVAVGAPAPLGLVVPATAVSWLAGYVTVVAPAGLGVREVTLVALLAAEIPPDQALAAAILVRVAWLAVDGAASVAAHGVGVAPPREHYRDGGADAA